MNRRSETLSFAGDLTLMLTADAIGTPKDMLERHAEAAGLEPVLHYADETVLSYADHKSVESR